MLIVAAVAVILSAGPVQAGVSSTSRVTLLRNEEYSSSLLQGIRDARKSILLSFYLFKVKEAASNQPQRIAQELVQARKRGVDVTVFLEKSNNSKDSLNDENRRTAAILHRGGVKVMFDSPNITTHTKAVVIDNRLVYLGSHNLTQSALRHNNELSVLIDSPEMAAEIKAFLDRL